MYTKTNDSQLTISEVGDEVVLYDAETSRCHMLDAAASAVFRAVDGTKDTSALALSTQLPTQLVEQALTELTDIGVVVEAGVTRRSALKRGALVTGALAASPMIISIVSPQVFAAASTTPVGTGTYAAPTVGQRVSLQPRSAPGSYVSHSGSTVSVVPLSSGSSQSARDAATYVITAGLADPSYVSFQSADSPTLYLRHAGYVVSLTSTGANQLEQEDATFLPLASGTDNTFQSYNFNQRYLRVYNGGVTIADPEAPYQGEQRPQDTAPDFANDSAFIIAPPLSP